MLTKFVNLKTNLINFLNSILTLTSIWAAINYITLALIIASIVCFALFVTVVSLIRNKKKSAKVIMAQAELIEQQQKFIQQNKNLIDLNQEVTEAQQRVIEGQNQIIRKNVFGNTKEFRNN